MKDLIDPNEAFRATAKSSLFVGSQDWDANVSECHFHCNWSLRELNNAAEMVIVPKTSTFEKPADGVVVW